VARLDREHNLIGHTLLLELRLLLLKGLDQLWVQQFNHV